MVKWLPIWTRILATWDRILVTNNSFTSNEITGHLRRFLCWYTILIAPFYSFYCNNIIMLGAVNGLITGQGRAQEVVPPPGRAGLKKSSLHWTGQVKGSSPTTGKGTVLVMVPPLGKKRLRK